MQYACGDSLMTLQEQVADHLRRSIWSGQLTPGQRLREIPLAARFGISRGPIRDVFLTLTREGLLQCRPNAGVSVASDLSPFRRRTLVRLRRTIETQALRQTMRTSLDTLLIELRSNLSQYLEPCVRQDLEEVVRLDMAFHRTIVAAADHGSLVQTWIPIVSQMFLRYSRHHSLAESYTEHAGIVDAIAAKDVGAACSALGQHIV
jgi:DNA-binding GntR family transcriptional regulator